MSALNTQLTPQDLAFMAEAVGRQGADAERFAAALRDDRELFEATLAADRLFNKFATDPEILVKASPRLYFAVLLQRAARDLRTAAFTIERTQRQRIPVFDTHLVADFINQADARDYLAEMLASFTKISSYTMHIPVQHGVWRRIRFNDMDVDGLIRFASAIDEAQRFGVYRRIADVCLFVSGVFPEYVDSQAYYPLSGQRRPSVGGRRRTMEEYQQEGKAFYQMAAEHEGAVILGLGEMLAHLAAHFLEAAKSVSYMAQRYLWFDKRQLFAG